MERTGLLFISALIAALIVSTQAHAFGSKRRVEHFDTNEQWSQAYRFLVDGLQTDISLLGELQAGPFELIEKGRPRSILTFREHETCTEVSRDPGVAFSRTRTVSCDRGPSLRKKARLPQFPGFVALSPEGRKALFTQVFEKDWRWDGECAIEGSDTIEAFEQRLKLHFEPRYDSDELDQLDVASYAHAFSTKRTVVQPEMRIRPIMIQTLLEHRDAGGYRFLLWGDRWEWDTEWENQIQVASIAPELMQADLPLRLFPRDKICFGEQCRELRSFELTQLLAAHAIEMQWNPKRPKALTLVLHRVNSIWPSVTLHYHR